MGLIVRASPVSICCTRRRTAEAAASGVQARGGGPLAGGDQYMPWIHIDDKVALILWALDTVDISGPVNAPAPNPGD